VRALILCYDSMCGYSVDCGCFMVYMSLIRCIYSFVYDIAAFIGFCGYLCAFMVFIRINGAFSA